MARYSDHGSVSLAACDTSVDLKRIDNNKFLREVVARMFLRDTQCKANGEGRREEVAMAMAVVLLLCFFKETKRIESWCTCHSSSGPAGPQS